jgi:hypothetical protein
MANRNFSRVQALNHEIKLISGNFSIAASGGAATKVQGLGWSVAKSNTGEYTITLEDSYVALQACTATVQAAVAVDLVAQIASHDVVTAKTIVLNLNAGATPTEPSAVTVVHFQAELRNSTVE